MKARLIAFYELYNKDKLDEIDQILERYKGKEDMLIRRLERKYKQDFPIEQLHTTFDDISDGLITFSDDSLMKLSKSPIPVKISPKHECSNEICFKCEESHLIIGFSNWKNTFKTISIPNSLICKRGAYCFDRILKIVLQVSPEYHDSLSKVDESVLIGLAIRTTIEPS